MDETDIRDGFHQGSSFVSFKEQQKKIFDALRGAGGLGWFILIIEMKIIGGICKDSLPHGTRI